MIESQQLKQREEIKLPSRVLWMGKYQPAFQQQEQKKARLLVQDDQSIKDFRFFSSTARVADSNQVGSKHPRPAVILFPPQTVELALRVLHVNCRCQMSFNDGFSDGSE